MRGRLFGAPRGAHRGHEPGSILDGGAKARARAAAPTTTFRIIPAAPPPPDVTLVIPIIPPPLPPPPPVRWSPVRYGVQVTARASSFRFPLRCFTCGREHRNLNADRFADLYASAARAGWLQDLFGSSWRCPRCFRRHDAVFGVRPTAAITPPPAPPNGGQSNGIRQ